MGDIVGINGQNPEEIIEDQAFDNFVGLCLIPLLCKWCGGIDDEMAALGGCEAMEGIRLAYESDFEISNGESKKELLEMTDDIHRLKDMLREVMIKFKNETEAVF